MTSPDVFLAFLLPLALPHPAPAGYTIDGVGLTVLPERTVETGTHVTFRCQVNVSRGDNHDLTHTFVFIRDDLQVHTATTTDSTVDYQLSPARAADSGVYECRVTVKEKSKSSFGQRLEVTGGSFCPSVSTARSILVNV